MTIRNHTSSAQNRSQILIKPKEEPKSTAEDNITQTVNTTNKAIGVLKSDKIADALDIMGKEAIASQIRDGVVNKFATKASAISSLGFVAANTSDGSLSLVADTKNLVGAADAVTGTDGIGKILGRGATGLGVAANAASLKGAIDKAVNGEAGFSEAKTILTTTRELKTATVVASKTVVKYGDEGVKVAKFAVSAGKGTSGAAAKLAARTGVKTAAKSAGRFLPGMNVAIAAVDTGIAVTDITKAVKDPTVSNVAKAALGSLTAAGSIAAATNIPGVSQVGAGVAIVADVAKVAVDVNWKRVGTDAKKVVTKAYKQTSRAVSQAYTQTSKVANRAYKQTSKAVSQAYTRTSKAANRAYKQTSKILNNTVKSISDNVNNAWKRATSWF